MTKYTPLFEAGQIGNGRISLAIGASAERMGIYGDGYGLLATARQTEAYVFINFFLWTLTIGFIKRKELRK